MGCLQILPESIIVFTTLKPVGGNRVSALYILALPEVSTTLKKWLVMTPVLWVMTNPFFVSEGDSRFFPCKHPLPWTFATFRVSFPFGKQRSQARKVPSPDPEEMFQPKPLQFESRANPGGGR